MAENSVTFTHPLRGVVVRVHLTIGWRVRSWLTIQLLRLAIWVSGGDLEITTDDG